MCVQGASKRECLCVCTCVRSCGRAGGRTAGRAGVRARGRAALSDQQNLAVERRRFSVEGLRENALPWSAANQLSPCSTNGTSTTFNQSACVRAQSYSHVRHRFDDVRWV